MKKAMQLLDNLIKLNTLDAKFVANIHDEWQIQVKESQAEDGIRDLVRSRGLGDVYKRQEQVMLR